jgi:hypothetical protein
LTTASTNQTILIPASPAYFKVQALPILQILLAAILFLNPMKVSVSSSLFLKEAL